MSFLPHGTKQITVQLTVTTPDFEEERPRAPFSINCIFPIEMTSLTSNMKKQQ